MEEEIKLQVIKSAIKKLTASKEIEEQERRATGLALLRAQKLKIDLDGQRDYFQLRKDWSFLLMCLLSLSIIFQFGVTILVGKNILDYREYSWFINLVMGENFVQIIGLCYVVVNFLFPKNHN